MSSARQQASGRTPAKRRPTALTSEHPTTISAFATLLPSASTDTQPSFARSRTPRSSLSAVSLSQSISPSLPRSRLRLPYPPLSSHTMSDTAFRKINIESVSASLPPFAGPVRCLAHPSSSPTVRSMKTSLPPRSCTTRTPGPLPRPLARPSRFRQRSGRSLDGECVLFFLTRRGERGLVVGPGGAFAVACVTALDTGGGCSSTPTLVAFHGAVPQEWPGLSLLR